MWKLLIADDEKIIRRGIGGAIDWNKYNIEIVGEAEDGEVALEKSKELKPDILLVDICMPFLNGLELIEAINKILPDTLIVIITGHDEFEYAQKALRMNVMDYLLKPIDEDELEEIICKMVVMLDRKKDEINTIYIKNSEVTKNFNYMRENFILDIINGDEKLFDEKLKYYNIDNSKKIGLAVFSVIENVGAILKDRTSIILNDIKNIIISANLNCYNRIVAIDMKNKTIVALFTFETISDFHKICISTEKKIVREIGKHIFVFQHIITDNSEDIDMAYSCIIKKIINYKEYSPSVVLAQKYIESYYYKSDLTLNEIAKDLNITPTYLSRSLKNELGSSFIEYLTKIRIKKAIEFMEDNSMKMYEIAEEVGYNTQHYFSTAFKKVMGVSPKHYKIEGEKNKNA
ncbi:response regulator transcription factor [Clostridium sp. DL1XJH146]